MKQTIVVDAAALANDLKTAGRPGRSVPRGAEGCRTPRAGDPTLTMIGTIVVSLHHCLLLGLAALIEVHPAWKFIDATALAYLASSATWP